jgi:small subunit ribosomal protein S13
MVEQKENTHKPNRMSQPEKHEERMVRILSKDIEGKMAIYVGLTKIKGISWSLSNLICKKLKIDKTKTIGSLTEKEIQQISEFIKNPQLPKYLMNRINDFETGKDTHLTGNDLDLRKEFDIKRLKKIKSYKGMRHTLGQPVRGQRTKSHFRTNRKKSSGVKVKKKEVKKE